MSPATGLKASLCLMGLQAASFLFAVVSFETTLLFSFFCAVIGPIIFFLCAQIDFFPAQEKKNAAMPDLILGGTEIDWPMGPSKKENRESVKISIARWALWIAFSFLWGYQVNEEKTFSTVVYPQLFWMGWLQMKSAKHARLMAMAQLVIASFYLEELFAYQRVWGALPFFFLSLVLIIHLNIGKKEKNEVSKAIRHAVPIVCFFSALAYPCYLACKKLYIPNAVVKKAKNEKNGLLEKDLTGRLPQSALKKLKEIAESAPEDQSAKKARELFEQENLSEEQLQKALELLKKFPSTSKLRQSARAAKETAKGTGTFNPNLANKKNGATDLSQDELQQAKDLMDDLGSRSGELREAKGNEQGLGDIEQGPELSSTSANDGRIESVDDLESSLELAQNKLAVAQLEDEIFQVKQKSEQKKRTEQQKKKKKMFEEREKKILALLAILALGAILVDRFLKRKKVVDERQKERTAQLKAELSSVRKQSQSFEEEVYRTYKSIEKWTAETFVLQRPYLPPKALAKKVGESHPSTLEHINYIAGIFCLPMYSNTDLKESERPIFRSHTKAFIKAFERAAYS